MSLQVWLPLNEDLHNQGLLGAMPENTDQGAANPFSQDGKIGKCLAYDDNYATKIQDSSNNNLISLFGTGHVFSVAFWFKLKGVGTSAFLFQIGAKIDNTTFGFWWTSSTSGQGPRLVWNDGNSGTSTGLYASAGYNTAIDYENWHHFVAIIDKRDQTQEVEKYYLDGQLIKTLNYNNSSAQQLVTDVSNNFIYLRPRYAMYNDFRVYDHALSAKEIEELAKGLVLHYKLNGELQYIVPSGYQQLEYLESTGTQYIDTEIIPLTTYTYKFKYALMEFNGYRGPFGAYTSEDTNAVRIICNNGSSSSLLVYFHSKAGGGPRVVNNLTTTTGEIIEGSLSQYHYSLTNLTTNNTISASDVTDLFPTKGNALTSPMRLYAANATTGISKTRIYYFETYNNDICIQKLIPVKRIADNTLGFYDTISHTMFTNKGSDTFVAGPIVSITGTIYDCSGYNNNGVLSRGTADILGNTPRYNASLCLSKKKISANTGFPTGVDPDFTIVFWTRLYSDITYTNYGDLVGINDIAEGANSPFRLELCGTPPGANLKWYRGPSGQASGGFNMNTNSSSDWFSKEVWHQIALTGNGTTKQYLCYLDGVQCGSYNGSSNTWTSDGQIYFGDTAEVTADFSDCRVYATVLTADQIKELYNTGASIDNNGNIYARELVEI